MQELIAKIKGMYQKLDGPLKTSKGGISDDDMNDGADLGKRDVILPYLIYIEGRLNYLMEARDYWTQGLTYNDLMKGNYDHNLIDKRKFDQALGVFDLERQIEKDVKTEIRLRKVHEEQEELQSKKRK